jgi:putative Mg2+ transporter-C (MgtC) family protein
LPDLSWLDVALRIGLAGVLAGSIGLERELRDREAGLRTHLLVGVGAALFTLVSAYGFSDFRYGIDTGFTLDPTRISAQIVTGIGFLGAGAIIRQGLSVRGLTTAATLWVVAAIGMAAGAGYYSGAVLTTVLVLVALWPLRIVAHRLVVAIRPEEGRLVVELPPGSSAVPVLAELERLGTRVDQLEIEDEEHRRSVAATVRLRDRRLAAEVVAALSELEGVRRVEWVA